ncbi:MAG TPA: GAP family protein [Candidatus Saccharimonadales bacterium]|jgi:hypothetical protein|nr:GAP family protein [Candidatus Saccharimonadales bacterium]
MFSLYISLALLGLSAVDPVGIGVMPVLLMQKHPYRRAFVFLGGSFVSLMVFGVLFAKGLGTVTIIFEQSHSWLVPSAEVLGGVTLLVIAVIAYVQLRTGKISVTPSKRTQRWLRLGNWQLFTLGALLVAVQSIIDVVFVIAMVRVGQLRLSSLTLISAVATYAITALVLQIVVVGAFKTAPTPQKIQTLDAIRKVLIKYSNQALIVVSTILGLVLLALALIR